MAIFGRFISCVRAAHPRCDQCHNVTSHCALTIVWKEKEKKRDCDEGGFHFSPPLWNLSSSSSSCYLFACVWPSSSSPSSFQRKKMFCKGEEEEATRCSHTALTTNRPTDRPPRWSLARSLGRVVHSLSSFFFFFFVTLLLTSVGLSLSPLPPRSSPLCCVSLVNTHLKVSDPRQIVVLVVVFPFILSSSSPTESTFSLFVFLFFK